MYKLGPPPNYAGEIWEKTTTTTTKNSHYFTVGPAVHTNPSRKRSLTKTFFKPEEFEYVGFAFWRGRKHFENEAFGKRWLIDKHLIFYPRFPQTQIRIRSGRWLLRFKFYQHTVDGKHLMCFQSETTVFHFFCVVWAGSQWNKMKNWKKKKRKKYDNYSQYYQAKFLEVTYRELEKALN